MLLCRPLLDDVGIVLDASLKSKDFLGKEHLPSSPQTTNTFRLFVITGENLELDFEDVHVFRLCLFFKNPNMSSKETSRSQMRGQLRV